MPCYHPVPAWLAVRKDGQKRMLFKEPVGLGGFGSIAPCFVPCGQCMYCRVRKALEWTMRCCHELQSHSHACFITLTYNEAHLPKLNGVPTVPSYTFDFQRFLKRLRKALRKIDKNISIRYYMVSEYGDKSSRPHYHAIIFGYDFRRDRYHWTYTDGHWIDRSPLLERCWGYQRVDGIFNQLGFCTVSDATLESIQYVARYTMKKIKGERAVDFFASRLRDYTHMSLRPGIGAEWLDRYHGDVYKVDLTDGQVYQDAVRHGARFVKPPRYYDKLMAPPPPPGEGGEGGAEPPPGPEQARRAAIIAAVREARADFAALQPPPDAHALKLAEEHARYVARQSAMEKYLRRDIPHI